MSIETARSIGFANLEEVRHHKVVRKWAILPLISLTGCLGTMRYLFPANRGPGITEGGPNTRVEVNLTPVAERTKPEPFVNTASPEYKAQQDRIREMRESGLSDQEIGRRLRDEARERRERGEPWSEITRSYGYQSQGNPIADEEWYRTEIQKEPVPLSPLEEVESDESRYESSASR